LTPRLEDVRFIAFDGIGHDVHIEAPDQLAEAISTFVRETSTTSD